MKKIYTLIGMMSLTAVSFGQVNEQGKFNIDLGVGAGVYNGSLTAEYNGTTDTDDNLDGLSFYWQADAEYSILDFVSAGVLYKRGFYALDDMYNDKNTMNTVGISARFYALNKDKFALYGNVGAGLSYLRQQDTFDDFSGYTNEQTYRWSGSDIGVGAGFKWMWTDYIGMNFGYEFNIKNYKLNSAELNGEPIFIFNEYEFSQKAIGHEVKLGLSFQF